MKALIIAGTAVGMALSGAAFAQSSGSSGPQSATPNGPGGNQLITAKKLAQDLEKAGLSDVKIVAESFVIQAKTKDGDPVVMTVGPHGMTAFETVTPDNTKTTGSTTSGSGSSSDQTTSKGTSTQK